MREVCRTWPKIGSYIAESIKEDGIASIDTLGLGYNDPTGPVRKNADGAELAQRALEEVDRKGLNVMEGADHKVAVLPSAISAEVIPIAWCERLPSARE